MIKLHVKGPRKTAQRAAARHGVPVRNCKTTLAGGAHRNDYYAGAATNCDAPCSAQRNVMHWYATRHPRGKAGRGLAPGTLLYFAAGRCDSSLSGARPRPRRRRRK